MEDSDHIQWDSTMLGRARRNHRRKNIKILEKLRRRGIGRRTCLTVATRLQPVSGPPNRDSSTGRLHQRDRDAGHHSGSSSVLLRGSPTSFPGLDAPRQKTIRMSSGQRAVSRHPCTAMLWSCLRGPTQRMLGIQDKPRSDLRILDLYTRFLEYHNAAPRNNCERNICTAGAKSNHTNFNNQKRIWVILERFTWRIP